LITVLPVVALLVIYGFYAQKLLAAEYTFNQALKAVTRNDGRETYRLLQEAITKNPTVDRYHSSYAQVNLALANSIAQKPDITDEDRQNISQLIQQAIREGKNAVALNPQRANSWEILASIYRAIIPLAEGADQFAAQTYNQAATLDPGNPNTRIALGGLFYAAGNYQSAIDIFSLATRVKPDHANAHYNLASAYREAGQVDAAIREMSVVLSLVGPGSDDFNLASKELEALQTKRAQTQGQQGSTNLTTPESQVPTDPSLNPPLELPEDAEPELNPSPLP
jgi:tetratricopeptide (TPR) repeat protein